MRVQNITGRAVDVPGGPSLSPAECGDVEESVEVQACIDAGLIAVHEAPSKKGGKP